MPTRPLPLQETACPCISHLTLLDRSERKYSASFFLSDNVQNKKASRGKTLYLQTTGTCFVKIYSVCKRLCVFWFMLCAEWLHSSVHGSPGESPGGGAVPSGEQRQPEYRHWGTVHVCVCVCFLCSHVCPFLCSMYPCIFYATVVSKVFLSVVLTTSISSPPLFPSLPPFFLHPPPPHFASVSIGVFIFLSPFSLSCFCLFLIFFVSHDPSLIFPLFSSACPTSSPPSSSLYEGLGRTSLIGSVRRR